jgi:hypothetical protein
MEQLLFRLKFPPISHIHNFPIYNDIMGFVMHMDIQGESTRKIYVPRLRILKLKKEGKEGKGE